MFPALAQVAAACGPTRLKLTISIADVDLNQPKIDLKTERPCLVDLIWRPLYFKALAATPKLDQIKLVVHCLFPPVTVHTFAEEELRLETSPKE